MRVETRAAQRGGSTAICRRRGVAGKPQKQPKVTADTQPRKQIALFERQTFASSRQLLGLVIIIVILLGRTG